MGHSHSHGQPQTATGAHKKRLIAVLTIYAAIVLAQLVGAWVTGSLALAAESMHMAIDASGILIALIAAALASRKASPKRSYGLMRAEIVAVLANCVLLFALGGFILVEAVDRWRNPSEVAGGPVIAFAAVGLAGAAASIIILSRGAKLSLNVRAAFLEVMSDGIGAAAIIVSGILNVTLGWNRGDAIAAAAIGVIILPRAFSLLKQAVNLIMQGVPDGIDLAEVREAIAETEGVAAVHSLHIWGLTSGVSVMSAHVVTDADAGDRGGSATLDRLTALMRERFHIEHVTIQLEEPGHLDHEGELNRELAGAGS